MRNGRVLMKDYDDYLEVCRAHESGLMVVCISNYPTLLNKAIARGKTFKATDHINLVAHPATTEKMMTKAFFNRTEHKLHLCTAGIFFFGERDFSRKKVTRRDISQITLEQVMNQL